MSDVVDERVAEFFLKEKPCRALYAIENLEDSECYARNVAKLADTTYSHTNRVIADLKEMGLVQGEKNGRKTMLRLTESGQEVAEMIRPLMHDTFELDSSYSLQEKYGGENP